MINNSMIAYPKLLKSYFIAAFDFFETKVQPQNIKVEYYPYINVNSRIKSSNGTIYIRIAELLNNAPPEVHKSLALILVAKLLGKRIPKYAQNNYQAYLNNDEFNQRVINQKRKKGRKIITTSKGKIYDLDNIFGKLNLIYFQNQVPTPTLSWSKRKTYRRLGHHDPVHNTIIISKSLDERKVPKFVVEFIVYHEMLHIIHPVETKNGRRFIHTPTFKRDEEKFAYFEEAERWIEENASKIKRNVTGKK